MCWSGNARKQRWKIFTLFATNKHDQNNVEEMKNTGCVLWAVLWCCNVVNLSSEKLPFSKLHFASVFVNLNVNYFFVAWISYFLWLHTKVTYTKPWIVDLLLSKVIYPKKIDFHSPSQQWTFGAVLSWLATVNGWWRKST